jgi:transposase-like protein
MARPTKYSEEKAEKIAARLLHGCTRKAAARSVGIDYDTFLNWRRRYSSFSVLVDTAEAKCAMAMSAIVTKAAQEGDWRASESWLKRRRPEEWGTDTSCRVCQVNMSRLSDEELLQAAYR